MDEFLEKLLQAFYVLNPETSKSELGEIENDAGFNGAVARMEALEDACWVACDAIGYLLEDILDPPAEMLS